MKKMERLQKQKKVEEQWYDVLEDWELIASSLTAGQLNVIKVESGDTYAGISEVEYLQRTGIGIVVLSLNGYTKN